MSSSKRSRRLVAAGEVRVECGEGMAPDRALRPRGANIPQGSGRPGGAASSSRWLLAPGVPGGFLDDGDICRPVMAWRKAGRPALLSPDESSTGALKGGGGTVLAPSGLTLGEVTISYRAVEFTVPSVWYSRWLLDYQRLEGSNGGGTYVSSVNLVLAGIWPEFRAASDAFFHLDDEYVDALLGCYNLGPVTDRSMFWRQGDDSHREAYRAMIRLIVAYGDGIDDQIQPHGGMANHASRCDGFRNFVRGVLQGGAMANSLGEKCKLTVNFDCTDARFRTNVDYRCGSAERECGKWFNTSAEDEGRFFDAEWAEWESGWHSASRTYRCADGAYFPETYSDWSAIGLDFSMTVHPILLAWAGFTADRILHFARIAWDYGRHSGDESYRTHAIQLGRYALSALVPLARTMIHEVGHSYTGTGGHCQFGCCFDIAARAWFCHVRARLGLPLAMNYDPHELAEFSSGSFTSAGARRGKLDHEFGGGQVRATLKSVGGRCDSEFPWWWYLAQSVDVTNSTGNYCWSCTIDRAGEAGAHGEFCLNRAWQVYEGTIDPWGSSERTLDRVDEWTLTRACPLPTTGDSQGWVDRLWCWSEE